VHTRGAAGVAMRHTGDDAPYPLPAVAATEHVSRVRHALLVLVSVIAVTAIAIAVWQATDSIEVSLAAQAGDALVDGRVYEEVSPANKNGNYVASGGATALTGSEGFAAASADGNALVFLSSGAMGNASSSMLAPYVARRASVGWTTSSATSPQLGRSTVFGAPIILVPSADFSRFVFGSIQEGTRYSPMQPAGPLHSLDLYLTEDPFAAPAWLGRPTIANAIPEPGFDPTNAVSFDFGVAGVSPSVNTVYFAYSGTLIEQDRVRAPFIGDGTGHNPGTAPWGFYEWTASGLAAAGVLPDGSVPAFGAVPAAVAGNDHHGGGEWEAVDFDNDVSLDGARAFFVSPDPTASTVTNAGNCETEGPCTSEPPQLYVRETAAGGEKRTLLISQSQLVGHVGEVAPDGAMAVADAPVHGGSLDSTYVYASPDGSHAFFASADRLTELAPEDGEVKEYDFNVDTGVLTYLPGVVGPIVASSRSGSDFIFKDTAAMPEELDLWTAGPGGGRVTRVAQLPGVNENLEARASADGLAFVFDTSSDVPGGFNNQSGFAEVYRYDVPSSALTCVSCPPDGVTASGNAVISYDNGGGNDARPRSTVDTRVISSDGHRVFFDTPDALLPEDSNGRRDVYEWENGRVHLISPGRGREDSFYLDNSESGNDVFFSTSDGLVLADADGAYDAYDARVPRPGDTPAPGPAACTDACRGAVGIPAPVGVPASTTLTGVGNLTPTSIIRRTTVASAHRRAAALRACRRRTSKHARHRCEAQVRRRYGPSPIGRTRKLGR
jgi:hypothetical protein